MIMKVKIKFSARPDLQPFSFRRTCGGLAKDQCRGKACSGNEYEIQNHRARRRGYEVVMNVAREDDKSLDAEIRCRKCNRLLMKGEVRHVEIKCPKCGFIQEIGSPGAEKE